MESMDDESLLAATKGLDVDDLADLLDELPETAVKQALKGMDYQYRTRLEGAMNYDEDTAGGLKYDRTTIRPDVTLDAVLKYLRLRKEMPQNTDNIIAVWMIQSLFRNTILSQQRAVESQKTVSESMRTITFINADTLANEVTNIFEDRDLVSAPVVDKNNILLEELQLTMSWMLLEKKVNTLYLTWLD